MLLFFIFLRKSRLTDRTLLSAALENDEAAEETICPRVVVMEFCGSADGLLHGCVSSTAELGNAEFRETRIGARA